MPRATVSGGAATQAVLDERDAGRQAALNRLSVLSPGWREILPSDKLRAQAEVLLDTYSLPAADSWQLASAMIWCQQRPARQRFVSSDVGLCEAAAQAGFAVVSAGLAIS